MSVVLILTHARDDTQSLVLPHLARRGIEYVRFNTEDFPTRVRVHLEIHRGQCHGALHFADRTLPVSEIATVWNRRPHQPEIDSTVTDPTVRAWAELEAEQGLYCLWSMLDGCFWVNPVRPSQLIDYNKLIQVVRAHQVGLDTPATLLSNDIPGITGYWDRLSTDLALKKVRRGVLEYPSGIRGLLHTVRLQRSALADDDIQRLRFYAALLQEYIEKATELRITVVGTKVFACEIASQVHEMTKDDWRRELFLDDFVPYRPFELPPDVAARCVALVQELGLYFGAIDMALTPDGRYVFFEINPNGQWGWIERLTGLPIGEAIADLLASATPPWPAPRPAELKQTATHQLRSL